MLCRQLLSPPPSHASRPGPRNQGVPAGPAKRVLGFTQHGSQVSWPEVKQFIEDPERPDTDGVTGGVSSLSRDLGVVWCTCPLRHPGIQEPVRTKTRAPVLFLGAKGSWHGDV